MSGRDLKCTNMRLGLLNRSGELGFSLPYSSLQKYYGQIFSDFIPGTGGTKRNGITHGIILQS